MERLVTLSFILSQNLLWTLAAPGEVKWGPPISKEELKMAAKMKPTLDEFHLTHDKMFWNHLEDDMGGSINSTEKDRSYVTNRGYRRWKDGVIPYRIDSGFSHYERRQFARAFNEITTNVPCVSFTRYRAGRHESWVDIMTATRGCHSELGENTDMFNKRHVLRLSPVCTALFRILRELLHVLGAPYEHNRPDRNEHVEILWDRIPVSLWRNYYRTAWTGETQLSPRCRDNRDILDTCVNGIEVARWPDLGYDLDSITHYDSSVFTSSSEVMRALNGRVNFGGGLFTLSPLDIRKLRRAYGCDTPPPPAALTILLFGGQRRSDVELISTPPSICDGVNITDVPIDTKGAIGLFDSSGPPMICGGTHNRDKQACYVYNKDGNTWSDGPRLTAPRDGAQAVGMPDGTYWIFGGARFEHNIRDVFAGIKFIRTWHANGLNNFCAVRNPVLKYSPDRFYIYLLAGKRLWVFDPETHIFTELMDHPEDLKRRACAMIMPTVSSSLYLVAVGGSEKHPQSTNAVYFYNPVNRFWTKTTDYPISIYGASVVPYGDSFVVIGGVSQTDPQPTEIYKYRVSDGAWVDTGLRMAEPRKFPVALVMKQEDICS